jgi:alkanesulfonate monooxygenase SsuD/methylene tetrahydromethanopterin reductase-like flavin-dependent oxidoreductase (luciferase family)
MEEGLRVIKGIWADGPYTFAGRHYSISEYDGWPKPIQRPHPPVFIGAGSKRLLSFAAREADIVGIVAPARSDSDHVDREGDTDARLTEQVRWVRDAAGARFGSLELAMLVWGVAVTSDRSAAAGQLAVERQMTTDQVLASPAFLIGSVDAIAERLLEQRERHGISHISVFPQHVEPFAPVVARLAGQ